MPILCSFELLLAFRPCFGQIQSLAQACLLSLLLSAGMRSALSVLALNICQAHQPLNAGSSLESELRFIPTPRLPQPVVAGKAISYENPEIRVCLLTLLGVSELKNMMPHCQYQSPPPHLPAGLGKSVHRDSGIYLRSWGAMIPSALGVFPTVDHAQSERRHAQDVLGPEVTAA